MTPNQASQLIRSGKGPPGIHRIDRCTQKMGNGTLTSRRESAASR